MFDSPGYELEFVQRSACKDGSDHLFTYIYKFYSPVTHYRYVVRAEYHRENVFGVKFYAKPHRGSDFKYSKLVNRGDTQNVLITCIKVIPLLLELHPTASFGFVAARSVDAKLAYTEKFSLTQRFRVYLHLATVRLGRDTFTHMSFPALSSYLLVNNKNTDVLAAAGLIYAMFERTYVVVPDVS